MFTLVTSLILPPSLTITYKQNITNLCSYFNAISIAWNPIFKSSKRRPFLEPSEIQGLKKNSVSRIYVHLEVKSISIKAMSLKYVI